MNIFRLSSEPFTGEALRELLRDPACGGFVAFEGWVRDHNEGLSVTALEYEAFVPLATREGERILTEAQRRFGVARALCVHRIGRLRLGDLAVYVAVSAAHRDEAFAACRFIIDEVKHHVPIWKKEYYLNGNSGWVNCERCATASAASHTAAAPHRHEH